MKKGISLVVLLITIIVLVIISGIIIFNSSSIFKKNNQALLAVDIANLKYLTKLYYTRRSGVLDFATFDFDVSNLSEQELEQFAGETITNNLVSLYVIDLNKINAEETNFGMLESGVSDRYLYSTETGKVYYQKGITVDGVNYYYYEGGD